jgi:hypothetical protein
VAEVSRRARLLREGHINGNGKFIEPGATTWSDVIPLMVMLSADYEGHWGSRLCGHVDKIRREADGWITGRLTTTLSLHGLACEADTDIIDQPVESLDVMTSLRLAAVTLGTRPVWDEMKIGAEDDD